MQNIAAEYPSTAKDMYRQVYYKAVDLAATSTSNQPDLESTPMQSSFCSRPALVMTIRMS